MDKDLIMNWALRLSSILSAFRHNCMAATLASIGNQGRAAMCPRWMGMVKMEVDLGLFSWLLCGECDGNVSVDAATCAHTLRLT